MQGRRMSGLPTLKEVVDGMNGADWATFVGGTAASAVLGYAFGAEGIVKWVDGGSEQGSDL